MRVTRRTLFSVFLASIVAVATWLAIRYRRARPEDTILAILRRRVGYLDIPEASHLDFAFHYVNHKGEHRTQLTLLAVFAPLLAIWSPYRWLPLNHPLRRLEDNVVSNFLQSTDFFDFGADEERRIAYKKFYLVGEMRCPSPFASNFYTNG